MSSIFLKFLNHSFDGKNIIIENDSQKPSIVTFDTSNNNDSSTYNLIEYWVPRDGTQYTKDIHSKFPIYLWHKVSNNSYISNQKESCLKLAEKHFISNKENLPLSSMNDEALILLLDENEIYIPENINLSTIRNIIYELENNINSPSPVIDWTVISDLYEDLRDFVKKYNNATSSIIN